MKNKKYMMMHQRDKAIYRKKERMDILRGEKNGKS